MKDPITLFTPHAQFEAALLNLELRSVLRGIIDEYFQYLTLIMKSGWERTIEIREVDKEKGRKRIKIHYKGFLEDTDKWRDYGDDLFPFVMSRDKVPFFDLERFYIVSSLSALQLQYSKF